MGCGVDLAPCPICHTIWQNRNITTHPDTDETFTTLKLPYWEDILMMAVKCYEITGMGYLGVDIVLDEERGPLLLEMNARPGLAIQTANMAGLLPRLRLIKNQPDKLSAEKKVKFAIENFQAKQVHK